jgi:hypothetical protein
MYTILKDQGAKKFIVSELPALGAALILSEGLYKFGSFILECSAFLVTWYGASFLFNKLLGARKQNVS